MKKEYFFENFKFEKINKTKNQKNRKIKKK